jgi:hypothetical protein
MVQKRHYAFCRRAEQKKNRKIIQKQRNGKNRKIYRPCRSLIRPNENIYPGHYKVDYGNDAVPSSGFVKILYAFLVEFAGINGKQDDKVDRDIINV